jgi:uncharacterized protein YndB with AHSA1/START domain
MGTVRVEARAESRAAPGAVFALLKDGATWPRWSMFDAFVLERPGREERLGVGAIRVFSTRISRVREEVVEIVPDRRLSYVLLSGLPLVGYQADVELEPRADGGTGIWWRASFDVRWSGTGWFWRLVMRVVLARVAGALAVGAEDAGVVAACSG